MANESSWYNIGFEEAIGEEAAGQEMYRTIHVYLNKDYSEHFVLPFYFLMGLHEYVWSDDGERLLLSACSGFFEYEVGLLPEKYARWTPIIVVADIANKQILKVYEGKKDLCWNADETDICSKGGLKEFAYDEWMKNYEARREAVEEIVKELESRYSRNMVCSRIPVDYDSQLDNIIESTIKKAMGVRSDKESPDDAEKGDGESDKQKVSKFRVVVVLIIVLIIVVLLEWARHHLLY